MTPFLPSRPDGRTHSFLSRLRCQEARISDRTALVLAGLVLLLVLPWIVRDTLWEWLTLASFGWLGLGIAIGWPIVFGLFVWRCGETRSDL